MPKCRARVNNPNPPGVQYTKYNDTMPQKLIDLMTEGGGMETFCAEVSISQSTFANWLASKPAFKEAYDIGKAKGKSFYTKMAKDHMVEYKDSGRVNATLWSMMMRMRYDMAEHRKLKIDYIDKAETAKERLDCIMTALSAGDLTAEEAAKLSKLVESTMKLDEQIQLEKRIEELEEALRNKQ